MKKGVKISDNTYVRLLKLKAELTSRDGKIRTFDDAIIELLESYHTG